MITTVVSITDGDKTIFLLFHLKMNIAFISFTYINRREAVANITNALFACSGYDLDAQEIIMIQITKMERSQLCNYKISDSIDKQIIIIFYRHYSKIYFIIFLFIILT